MFFCYVCNFTCLVMLIVFFSYLRMDYCLLPIDGVCLSIGGLINDINFASVYVVSVVESSTVDNRLDFASFYIFFVFLFLIIFQSSRRQLSTVYCRTTVYTKVKRRAGNSGWRTCSFEHESKPCDVWVS